MRECFDYYTSSHFLRRSDDALDPDPRQGAFHDLRYVILSVKKAAKVVSDANNTDQTDSWLLTCSAVASPPSFRMQRSLSIRTRKYMHSILVTPRPPLLYSCHRLLFYNLSNFTFFSSMHILSYLVAFLCL